MEDNFHDSEHLPKERLMLLIRKTDSPALLQFTVMYLLILGSGVWVVTSWGQSWWQMLMAHFAFGIMCCSNFAGLHETAHNTAFKSKILGNISSRLAAITHLYASTMFREFHFTHHRYTHEPGLDPEISFGGKPMISVVSSLPMYLAWLSGLPLLLFKIKMLIMGAIGMPEPIRKALYPFIKPRVRTALFVESAYILLLYIGFILLAIYINSGFWGIFTGQAVGHCMLASYNAPEHNGLPHEGNIMEKTRSMNTNIIVKTLMWNMPYHAEHHAYPAVPFHALPALHKELKADIKHGADSYPGFHLKVLGRKNLL